VRSDRVLKKPGSIIVADRENRKCWSQEREIQTAKAIQEEKAASKPPLPQESKSETGKKRMCEMEDRHSGDEKEDPSHATEQRASAICNGGPREFSGETDV